MKGEFARLGYANILGDGATAAGGALVALAAGRGAGDRGFDRAGDRTVSGPRVGVATAVITPCRPGAVVGLLAAGRSAPEPVVPEPCSGTERLLARFGDYLCGARPQRPGGCCVRALGSPVRRGGGWGRAGIRISAASRRCTYDGSWSRIFRDLISEVGPDDSLCSPPVVPEVSVTPKGSWRRAVNLSNSRAISPVRLRDSPGRVYEALCG